MPNKKFRKWLEDIAGIRGWNVNEMLNDNTYNYEHFYNTQPHEAKDMLNQNSDAHFTDIAKTSNHPTFSIESDYSGKVSKYNPRGIIGGTWSDAPKLGKNASRYTLSKSQLINNWNIPRTIDYLNMAEDNGVELRLPNGTMPYVDSDRFAGVLPTVYVVAKNLKNITPRDSQKSNSSKKKR